LENINNEYMGYKRQHPDAENGNIHYQDSSFFNPNPNNSSLLMSGSGNFQNTHNFGSNQFGHENSNRVNYYNPNANVTSMYQPKNQTLVYGGHNNPNTDLTTENSSQKCEPELRHTDPKLPNYIPEGCAPKLQNIVSTLNLKCTLDLREIALRARNAEYNPKRFAAVIMRIREPKTTALIFASGKMVCTGARNEDDSRKASRQYAKIIRKLGFNVKFSEFKIQNIVGSCDVKFPIRLEGLASEHSQFCNYEPEMFPGLIYRMIRPKIVLLIFVSGKIVLTGAKEREDIFKAFEIIYTVLLKYRKKETHSTISALPSNN